MKWQTAIRVAILNGLLTGVLFAVQEPAPAPSPADNTRTNERDRNSGQATADQQKENTGDRDLAKHIRQALVKDKSLSTYAHNVKIVAQNGQVTLKGPVRSEEEKKAIETKAAEIAGEGNVTSQLQVAPPKQ